MSRRLVGSGAITAAGAVAFNAGQLLVVTVLARRSSPVEVGVYALALAVTTPIFTLGNMSTKSVLVSDPDGDAHFPVYRRVRLLTTALGVAVATAITVVHPAMGVIALLVAVAKGLDAVADLYSGGLQKHLAFVSPAVSQMVNGALTPLLVLLLALSVGISWSLVGSVIASAVALGIVVLAHERWRAAHPAPVAATALDAGRLVRLAAPLGVASTLIAMSGNMPRYFLSWTRGEAELGVFSAVSFITIAGLTVFSGVAQVLLPNFVLLYERDGVPAMVAAVRRGAVIVAGLGVAALLGLALLGRPVVSLLYGAEYVNQPMLLLLGVGMVVAAFSWVVDLALTTLRAFRPQMVASVAAVAAGLLLSPWLTASHGALGAAWVTLLTYVAHLLARLWCLARVVRRRGSARPTGEEMEATP